MVAHGGTGMLLVEGSIVLPLAGFLGWIWIRERRRRRFKNQTARMRE